MMAYDSGHVACVIVNGQVKREQSEGSERTVRIPFDSEYAIRIKNKTNYRSLVKVLIDGTICAERLLLRPQQSIDLERFVIDGDLSKGNRFKFVSAQNPNVQDPTAGENGLIQVIVEPEVHYTYAWNPPTNWGIWNFINNSGPTIYGASNSGGAGGGGAGAGGAYNGQPIGGTYMNVNTGGVSGCVNSTSSVLTSNSTTSHSYSSNSAPTMGHSVELPKDAGATVEGSQSNQRFYETNEWFQTSAAITIPIRLRGPKQVEKFWHLDASARTFYRTDGRGQYDSWSVEGGQLVLRLPIDQVKIA
jgi:hypothetical protein